MFNADVHTVSVKKGVRRQETVKIIDRGPETIEISFPKLTDVFLMVDLVVRDAGIFLEVLHWPNDFSEHPPRKEIVLYTYPTGVTPCETDSSNGS
jgi:hypothetical protein